MQMRAANLTAFFLSIAIASTSPLAAPQDKAHRPSPPAQANCKLPDGKTINVAYSSPQMKGRKIFGEVVPFGKVWRAGANEATSFVTDTAIAIGGQSIPAGNYTLFALPNPDRWTLIISKKTGEWGIPYPGEADDVARVEMKVSKLSSPMENFTIAFDAAGSTCTMHLEWETTRASVAISEKK